MGQRSVNYAGVVGFLFIQLIFTVKSSLLARLQAQPEALGPLLFGLTEAQIQARPQPGNWSIFENLAHLARYEAVFRERIQRMLGEENPTFPRYVADEDPGFAAWCAKSFQRLSQETRTQRADLNQFLAALSPAELARTAQHPVYGPMTVEGWTEFFLLHEAHHLLTILKLGGTWRQTGPAMGEYSTGEAITTVLQQIGNRLRVRVFGLCRDGDRLLLVRHRALLHEGSFWEVPGGGVEFGESLTEAVAREFLEETGLVVRVGEMRFVSELRNGPLHAVELFFEVFSETTAAVLGHDPELDHQTMQELAWLTWEEIAAIPAREKHAVFSRVGGLDALFGAGGFLG